MRKTIGILIALLLYSSAHSGHASWSSSRIDGLSWNGGAAIAPLSPLKSDPKSQERAIRKKQSEIDKTFFDLVPEIELTKSVPMLARTARQQRLYKRGAKPPVRPTKKDAETRKERLQASSSQPSKIPSGPSNLEGLDREVKISRQRGMSLIPVYHHPNPQQAWDPPHAQTVVDPRPARIQEAGTSSTTRVSQDPVVSFKGKRYGDSSRVIAPPSVNGQTRRGSHEALEDKLDLSRSSTDIEPEYGQTIAVTRPAAVSVSPFSSKYAQGFGSPPGLPKINVTGDLSGGVYDRLRRELIFPEAQGVFASHIPMLQLPETPKSDTKKPPGLPRTRRW